MSYRITKEHVWVGPVDDRPGALAEKLHDLAEGGLNLELIISRRDWSGVGLLFVSPLRTLDELEVAAQAGLSQEKSIRTIRIEGPNAKGLGSRIAGAIADAGLNMRGFSAAALGEQSVTNIAFDNDADGDRAREILDKLLNG